MSQSEAKLYSIYRVSTPISSNPLSAAWKSKTKEEKGELKDRERERAHGHLVVVLQKK